jgi:hypothetical protein
MPAHQEQNRTISVRQASPCISEQHAASVGPLQFDQTRIQWMLGWRNVSPDTYCLFDFIIRRASSDQLIWNLAGIFQNTTHNRSGQLGNVLAVYAPTAQSASASPPEVCSVLSIHVAFTI